MNAHTEKSQEALLQYLLRTKGTKTSSHSTNSSCWGRNGPQHWRALENKEVKHNTFRSPLIGIKMPPLELRADSDYLVNLLEGPLFSPAPLQCQKHSVHLISSPRRADIKESVYWHKTEMELTTTQSTCLLSKGGRTQLQTILYWIYYRRGLPCLSVRNNPHYQSVPQQLCPDLLPWQRPFLPGTGTFTASELEQQGEACWLSFKCTECETTFFTLLLLSRCVTHTTEVKECKNCIQVLPKVKHYFIPL